MELKQLRLFLAVAEELNFTRAAHRMHIAQPALSQHILNLERLLGTQLFRRNKQAVTLTQAGEELHLHARKVLRAADSALSAVGAVRDGKRGHIAIGAIYSAVHSVLPVALDQFRKRHPDITISLREQTVAQQVAALRHGLIDVGFMRDAPVETGFVSEILSREPLVVVLKATDPLALEPEVDLTDLSTRPFIAISRDENFLYSEQVSALFAARALTPEIGGYASDMHTTLCMVLAGLGVSIVPASVACMSNGRLAFRPIADAESAMNSTLVWKEDSGCACLSAFVDIVKDISGGVNEN
tara:strand:- start:19035 stop:19931 length:897 start_codon:yes stop_codon:yes gene_type:complete